MPRTVGEKEHGPFRLWEKLSVAGGQRPCVRGTWGAKNTDAGEGSRGQLTTHSDLPGILGACELGSRHFCCIFLFLLFFFPSSVLLSLVMWVHGSTGLPKRTWLVQGEALAPSYLTWDQPGVQVWSFLPLSFPTIKERSAFC